MCGPGYLGCALLVLAEAFAIWVWRSATALTSPDVTGVRLFLVTNSRLDYSKVLMSFSFGDDWDSLFDVTIVDAKKPAFFSQQVRAFCYSVV
jgi:hypothetical protein